MMSEVTEGGVKLNTDPFREQNVVVNHNLLAPGLYLLDKILLVSYFKAILSLCFKRYSLGPIHVHSPCINSSLVILLFFRPMDNPYMDSTCKIKLNFLIYFSLLDRPLRRITCRLKSLSGLQLN